MIQKFGGRKILAAVVAVAAGGITVAFKGDIPPNFLALLQTTLGAFVGGNIAEHWAKKYPSPTGTSVDLGTVNEKLDAMTEIVTVTARASSALLESNAQATKMAQDIIGKYSNPIQKS